MLIPDELLSAEERMIFTLRALYSSNGYRPFKMDKFEEYDLYAKYKAFLVSEGVITFTDTDGHLMALRPDVTLSIVKGSRYEPGSVQKLYYDEKVYRTAARGGHYREIPQMGLEVLGDLGDACVSEVLDMAAQTLARIDEDYLLSVSHPGMIFRLLDRMDLSPEGRGQLLRFLGTKSVHEIRQLTQKEGVPAEQSDRLEALLRLSGSADEVLPPLEELLPDMSFWIRETEQAVSRVPKEHVRIDFSVPGNMRYYSGIVFSGYVRGIPSAVLSGGRYDLLMKRVGKQGGAIGFALYLDLLGEKRERPC